MRQRRMCGSSDEQRPMGHRITMPSTEFRPVTRSHRCRWGKPTVPPTVTIDRSVDMKTPPKVQVDTLPADKFFAYAAELLKVQPPHITDEPIIARLKRIGFEAG